MKPYGVRKQDQGCCPGHDKYPAEYYGTVSSRRAHKKTTRAAHKRARSLIRRVLRNPTEGDSL